MDLGSLKDEMMRESCAFFASEILSGPQQAPYNGRFIASEHHIAWDKLLESPRLCVLAPRNHGKTYFFSFAYPIWKAFYGPGKEGYIFSATDKQAERILEDVKEEIETNPKLSHLCPANKIKNWTSKRITLANGHTIRARGYGTKTRGAHPDWIVVDDGLNDEDATSEAIRTKHNDYFFQAITPMINPGGEIRVVGTPFHAADLYGELAQSTIYAFAKTPAIQADGTALWPERFCLNRKDLAILKSRGIEALCLEDVQEEIGSIRFTREFLCEPVSDSMSIFPKRLFHQGETLQYMLKLGQSREYYVENCGVTSFYCGFDFAMSSSTSADYTVGIVVGVDTKGNRWVVDIQRHKGLPYGQQKGLINALGRKYDCDLIYLEANQMQRIFGDELIRETDLPIYKFITSGVKKDNGRQPTGNTHTMNKNTLEGGVPQLRVLFENSKVRVPYGDARSVNIVDIWITEMQAFTWLQGKLQGVGQHDDTVMAFWIANAAARTGGSMSTGVDEDLDFDPTKPVDVESLYGEDVDVALEAGEDPVRDLLGGWGMEEVDLELMFGSTDDVASLYEDDSDIENP